MGRHGVPFKYLQLSFKFPTELYNRILAVSEIETAQAGYMISVNELIRSAVAFVYDNDLRLRECFRRSRMMANSRRDRKNKRLQGKE